jgi:N-dimethylarginine dimethylaminohydrolase
LDLALAVISPSLIAWCPEAFLPKSQERIRAITDIEKIEVSLDEAMKGFACNLVSTGESVVMSNHAPILQKQLEDKGLSVYTPNVSELLKGGGFIRCTSLSID